MGRKAKRVRGPVDNGVSKSAADGVVCVLPVLLAAACLPCRVSPLPVLPDRPNETHLLLQCVPPSPPAGCQAESLCFGCHLDIVRALLGGRKLVPQLLQLGPGCWGAAAVAAMPAAVFDLVLRTQR